MPSSLVGLDHNKSVFKKIFVKDWSYAQDTLF